MKNDRDLQLWTDYLLHFFYLKDYPDLQLARKVAKKAEDTSAVESAEEELR